MSDANPSAQAKRKQYILLAIILIGVFAIATIGVIMTDDGPAPVSFTKARDLKTKSYIAPGEKVDPADAWRGVSDTRLNTVEGRMSSLENENRELKRRLEEKAGSPVAPGAAGATPETMSGDELDRKLAAFERSVARPSGYPPGAPGAVASDGPWQPPAATALPGPGAKPPPVAGQPGANGQLQMPSGGGIMTVRLNRGPTDPAGKATAATAPSAAVDPKNQPKTTKNYLPSGMFGQAVLLSGLDAPTGGQAQSNPHPVLLQLLDLAVLPSRYRYDWNTCHITAAGYGDLSSERGYLRTESLSCVSKDGRVLDVPIKGYIVGEDGKAGMRGRLVSKQGQVLGNALLAGVVSGIGSGLERTSQIQAVSPLGTTTTTKPGSEFQAGIGSGVGRSLDKLSNYYIQLAEKLFPVIEIDGGRVVDVVLTQGAMVDVESKDE